MKNVKHSYRVKGFSMTESLIALVILSFGLIALVKFQAALIERGGLIKSKQAAMMLAQDKMEQLRNSILKTQYTALTDTPSTSDCDGDGVADGYQNDGTITHTNTSFIRCYRVATIAQNLAATPPVPAYKNISVEMRWTDPHDGAQNVTINSFIAWSDPADSAYLAAQNAFTYNGIGRPSGGATLGGTNSYTPGSLPAGATGNSDGTSTYTNPNTGVTELINNTTGAVLLTVFNGYTLEKISGNVYTEGTAGSAYNILNASYPVGSDASYCTRSIDTTNSVYSAPASPGVAAYSYYNYTCYVGSGWYGSIGVVRTDNPNTNARVCVGDPAASTTKLSTIRVYRGYTTKTDSNGNLIRDVNNNAVFFPIGIQSNTTISNHHFLVTTITGNPIDSDCAPKMVINSMSDFTGNPDDFYCLTGSCPQTSTTTNISITGSITGGLVSSVRVSPNNQACTMTGSSGSYTYVCNVSYISGTNWSGGIDVTAGSGYEVCSTNPLPLTGLTASSSGNDVTVATSGTCPNVNYNHISGTISLASGQGHHQTNFGNLGISISAGSCSYSYTNGSSSASYTCNVRNGFNGTVTLTGYSAQDSVVTLNASGTEVAGDTYDYQGNTVNADVTGKDFRIYP